MNLIADPIGDRLLVMRTQQGDKRAFDLLVKKYRCRIFRIVSRATRNRIDADDVVQEIFVRAYCAIDRFRGESSFYTWLYRIAMNATNTYHHRQSTARYSSLVSNVEEDNKLDDLGEPLEFDTPETTLGCKQMATALSKTMQNLPTEFKAAFDLRELHGLSYEKIAAQLGCPVGTVRSRIFRARELIGNCLRQFGHSA